MKSKKDLITKTRIDQIKQKTRWSNPQQLTGDRIGINSECCRFCIIKEKGVYTLIRLTGSIWKSLGEFSDAWKAKQVVDEPEKTVML